MAPACVRGIWEGGMRNPICSGFLRSLLFATALPLVLLSTNLAPVVVDVSHHGSTFLREFVNQSHGRYYHPATVRYYKITLAHELLSSMEEGSKSKTVEVGKAFLEKLPKPPA